VVKEINEPASVLKGKMKAKSLKVAPWTAADINADPDKLGLKGSPTQVVRIFPPRRAASARSSPAASRSRRRRWRRS